LGVTTGVKKNQKSVAVIFFVINQTPIYFSMWLPKGLPLAKCGWEPN
jgi:hypothetical protein